MSKRHLIKTFSTGDMIVFTHDVEIKNDRLWGLGAVSKHRCFFGNSGNGIYVHTSEFMIYLGSPGEFFHLFLRANGNVINITSNEVSMFLRRA